MIRFFIISVVLQISYTLRTQFSEKKQSQCDLEVQNNICLFQGNQVLSSNSIDEDLVGHWSFNEESIFDQTNYKSPVNYKNIEVYPGMTGYGNSGGFNMDSTLLINTNFNLETQYSFQFQFYLQEIEFVKQNNQDYDNLTFPIYENFKKSQDETILNLRMNILGLTKQIKIQYSIRNKSDELEEHEFISQSSILVNKWTHITVIREDNILQLWINGFKDTVQTPKHSLYFGEEKNHKIFFGNTNNQINDTNNNFIKYQIDNIKIYKKVLQYFEIQAEAETFLGGLSPQQYSLGCQNCKVKDIKCDLENYHYCTSFELLSGGYQVARNMGWMVNNNQNIWSFEGIQQQLNSKSEQIKGLGMCCKNLSSE